jgi:hypothetical protein
MAEICDDFSKLLIILDNRWPCHKGERDCNFSVSRVSAYVYIAIGSFIVSKCKAGEFYALVLPLTVNNMILIEQSAGDVY